MTKRTGLFTWVTTLLILGLAACGGGGGDGGGGGGGGGLPSASNSAITAPPSTSVAITAGGAATSNTNKSIAANSYQASDAPLKNTAVSAALAELPVGVQAANSGAPALPDKLVALVRREAQKIRDHQASATGVLQAQPTQACAVSGTKTSAFDDANGNFTEVFVNCNEGGEVTHGTLSASNVVVGQNLGSSAGDPYSISVTATFSIDLSITTAQPASSVVTQGALTFTVSVSGLMEAAADGSVVPGAPSQIHIALDIPSLLSQTVDQNGTVRERVSSFSIMIDSNDVSGKTVTGHYTYASTAIGAGGGTVVVKILSPIVTPPGASDPNMGTVEITSPPSPGKIVLNVVSSAAGVTVNVYANASDPSPTDIIPVAWATLNGL
ncbi:MAG TPA: hypothetical protein VKE95_09190 [Burkholderiales bacterium]|nr:hypothetical protein [Burkholderiales bacterium]